MKRPLYTIAEEIKKDWGAKIYFGAKPYIDAMFSLNEITDNYIQDSGREIVNRFLCNATRWRGEVARKVTKELNDMVKASYKR